MPAAAMTFDGLVTDIKDYLERGDVADVTVVRQIPRIINNTERLLANKFKITGYLSSLQGTMQGGQNVIAKPDNWRSTASINYGATDSLQKRTTLRERSYEYMRSIYPVDNVAEPPVFYCDYDLQHWLVLPTPDLNYPFEAMCYILPPLLDDTNQQNYLTQYAPFCLLYNCLVGMEPFLRNDERIDTWKGLADDAFNAINVEDIRRMVDRGMARATN